MRKEAIKENDKKAEVRSAKECILRASKRRSLQNYEIVSSYKKKPFRRRANDSYRALFFPIGRNKKNKAVNIT